MIAYSASATAYLLVVNLLVFDMHTLGAVTVEYLGRPNSIHLATSTVRLDAEY
jgi:hypothetical protein